MAYGTVKADSITFTSNSADVTTTFSGIYASTTNNLTLTGTAQAITFTGTTANFVSGVFSTQVSGATVIAPTGTFTSLTGTTATFTSGIIASGTAALPSLAILSDPNTGIYSPGGDQLAVATNGTGRLFIDASGNINLGQASSALQSAGTGLTVYGASSSEIKFLNSTTGALDTDGTALVATSTDFIINNREAGFIALGTSNTERLRITSAGNVGIGTTSPGYKLHVSGTTGIIKGDSAGASFLSPSLDLYDSTHAVEIILTPVSGLGAIGTYSNHPFAFYTNNAERARIDSSGSLLVGTIASPAHQLQVSTDSAGKPSTNTWTIVSDERIKEEIELADLDLCYQAVKNIPLKRFKWKDEVYTEEQVRDRRKLGWIAQDVEAVFPKAVGTYEFKYNQVFEETIIPAVEEVLDDEGNVTTPAQPERIEKGELISEDVIEDCRDLNSDQLYAAMYGAIQKLMIKVETLETELAALKAS